MSSISWFGVPVTVPVPVTVIRPELTAATRFAGCVPPDTGPVDGDPEPSLLQPPAATAASTARHPISSLRRAEKP
jgi:hypothetical protein